MLLVRLSFKQCKPSKIIKSLVFKLITSPLYSLRPVKKLNFGSDTSLPFNKSVTCSFNKLRSIYQGTRNQDHFIKTFFFFFKIIIS
jgi:hypothetical protein